MAAMVQGPLVVTADQHRVLTLLEQGHSNAQIAERLRVSRHTVAGWISAVCRANGLPDQSAVLARLGVEPSAANPAVQRITNGVRAAELSAAARHALAALKTGRTREAIDVLEAVL